MASDLPGPALAGLLAYFAGCLLCLTAGLGLLRLLRTRLPPGQTLLFAPGATLALLALALGLGITWRQPVRVLAGPLWGLLGLLALGGLPELLRSLRSPVGADRQATRSALLALLLSGLLPLVLLAPHFRSGLRDFPGVVFGDGWSYVAYAQYLWELPRGTFQDLTPLHAYASHLSESRHVSPGLLAFLSPVARAGDPQAVVGLFVALALFQCGCACATLGSVWRLGQARLLCYLLLSVPVGWVAYVLAFSNYDHALALSFHPLLAAGTAVLEPRGGRIALLGLVGAAGLYAYPELFGLAVLAALVVAGGRWLRFDRQRRQSLALAIAASLALGLTLTAPTFRTTLPFFTRQLHSIEAESRPGGGILDGLLRPGIALSSFWALGGEAQQGPPAVRSWRTAMGLGLTLLSLAGAVRLARRGRGEPAIIAGLQLAAAVWMLVGPSYSYAAYKLLSMSCWPLGLCLVAGLERLARVGRGAGRAALVWGPTGAILLAHVTGGDGCRGLREVRSENGATIGDFRALEALAPRLGPGGVVVNVAGPAAQQWALYFLRDLPLRVLAYHGYPGMPQLAATMERARGADWANVTYLLSDERVGLPRGTKTLELVEALPPYRLWRFRQDVALVDIAPRTWSVTPERSSPLQVGPHGLQLTIVARRPGTLALTARVRVRPSEGSQPAAGLLVIGEGGRARLEADGERHTALLPVSAGFEQLLLARLPLLDVHAPQRLSLGDLALALVDAIPPAQPPSCPIEGPRVAASDAEEIVAQDATTGGVHFLRLAPGRPSLRLGSIGDAGQRLSALGSGDFDGDGRLDWLVWLPALQRLGLLLADRSGALGELGPMPTSWSREWRLASTRDLDGDGRADLVFQHEASGQVVVRSLECGLRLRSRSPTPAAPVQPGWQLAGAGDIDGDGQADLIFQHAATGRCAVWFLDAELRRRRSALFRPPEDRPSWRLVAVGALEAPLASDDRITSLLFSDASEGRWALMHLRADGSERDSSVLSAGAAASLGTLRVLGPR